jgi:hypothetical protein
MTGGTGYFYAARLENWYRRAVVFSKGVLNNKSLSNLVFFCGLNGENCYRPEGDF